MARCGSMIVEVAVTSTASLPIIEVVWMQREAEVDGVIGAITSSGVESKKSWESTRLYVSS